MPVTPRPAATVILARPAAGPPPGFETLMLKRPDTSRFAPGVYVFPGGAVGPADLAEASDHLAGALRLAAVREVFEEVGILLAYDEAGDWAAPQQVQAALAERHRLHGDRVGITDLLARLGLRPAAEALVPFSHWITPEASPRRFDVRFFIAPFPPGQVESADPHETRGTAWWQPTLALEAHDRAELPLMSVTRRHLLRLSRFATLAEALAYGVGRDIRPVTGVMRQGPNGLVERILPDQVEPEWRD